MDEAKIIQILHSDGYLDAENYIQRLQKKVEQDERFMVVEVCPHCENEVEMRWSVAARGYKAFCPVCGNRLMLCDECLHSEESTGGCNFCSETDSCKHNPLGTAAVDELVFLKSFAEESCFDEEICRDQLRMLWTAFCLHSNYDVDTYGYDLTLHELWEVLQEAGDGTSDWSDYDGFDKFMCAYLV